jgi:hypothetical protein
MKNKADKLLCLLTNVLVFGFQRNEKHVLWMASTSLVVILSSMQLTSGKDDDDEGMLVKNYFNEAILQSLALNSHIISP